MRRRRDKTQPRQARDRLPNMNKIKHPPETNDGQHQAAERESIKQIAKNAVHGGPKDVKKDKRSGLGSGQKG